MTLKKVPKSDPNSLIYSLKSSFSVAGKSFNDSANEVTLPMRTNMFLVKFSMSLFMAQASGSVEHICMISKADYSKWHLLTFSIISAPSAKRLKSSLMFEMSEKILNGFETNPPNLRMLVIVSSLRHSACA